MIIVRFGITTCRPCPAREQCTTARRNGRQLTILPRDQHELQVAVRAVQQDQNWQDDYKRRAGIEGTISQAVAVTGCRRPATAASPRLISSTSTQPWHSTSAGWTPTGTTPP